MSKITREAIHHIPKSNYSYGYNKETLHIRVKTKKGEVQNAILRIGDPYDWSSGGCDGGNMAQLGTGWIGGENIKMKKEVETEYFDYWIAEYKPRLKRSRYAFVLEGTDEKILFTEKKIYNLNDINDESILSNIFDFYCFPYLNNIDVSKAPEWAKDIIWYQIFPDRFCNGDKAINPKDVKSWGTEPTGTNFMGGDLQGIIDKLDYLEDIGITGLYFCPIFKARANHRYDTIDYKMVDEYLGDKEKFKELVDKAHARGMKIMLDAVFNHIGFESVQWQDVLKNGEKSKYKDWFYINKYPVIEDIDKIDGKNLNYEVFGRTHLMPKLNTENKEVIKFLLDVARYWVEEMNIDAWRLDVCNEVDHCFWRKFRETVLDINKDIYILGEVWHDGLPWLMGDQFDSVMNYPLGDAIREYFLINKVGSKEFMFAINQLVVNYPIQVTENMFNLLDSHDTTRILTLANGDKRKVKLALLFMFTQFGSPCIYYGTEIGMEGLQGMGSELHRRCMRWNKEEQDLDMFNFIKKIIYLKKEFKDEFKDIHTKWLTLEDDYIIYERGSIIIFMNNSNKNIKIKANGVNSLNKKFVDLINNKEIMIGEKLELNPYEFLVLK